MLGIMGALPQEVESLQKHMTDVKKHEIGMRTFYVGKLFEKSCVVVCARVGKVAAAATASALIHCFKVEKIVFTGVAGAISEKLSVGDIVVGTELVQHDMDARPLFRHGEVPLLGRVFFETDSLLRLQLAASAHAATDEVQRGKAPAIEAYGIHAPKVWEGRIASGDRFFASEADVLALRSQFDDILCVEMEGAAVAQVCYEHCVPFGILRIISDHANHKAKGDFECFIRDVAPDFSLRCMKNFLSTAIS